MSNGADAFVTTLLADLLDIHRETDPTALCRGIVAALAPVAGGCHALVLLLDRPRRVFRTAAFEGSDGPPAQRLHHAGFTLPEAIEFSALWPLLVELQARGEPVRLTRGLSDVLGDAWGAGPALGIQGVLRVGLVAAAPVSLADGPAGLLVLLAGPNAPERVVSVVAAHGAVALANALARAEARTYAEIDPETWVHNRSALDDAAGLELERAARYGHALSVIVVESADAGLPRAMLRTLATHLARSVRQLDLVGRLDERSFALLLPETAGDGAEVVLQRVHERAAADQLTITAGVATHPHQGRTWQDLLAAARPQPATARVTQKRSA